MDDKSDTNRIRGYAPVIVLIMLAALIAGARLHTYNEPLERDIMTYAVDAHELLNGRKLYRDAYVNQPPGAHAAYTAAEHIAGYGRNSIYFLIVLSSLVTLVGVYAAGVAFGGKPAGLWAAVFWTLISGWLTLQANQPNNEVFINALLIWAFALMIRAGGKPAGTFRFLATGILFAAASIFKPIAVACAFFLSCCHIAFPPAGVGRSKAAMQVAVIALTGLSAWLAVFGYFKATGRWSDFTDLVFKYNVYYSGSVIKNIAIAFFPRLILRHISVMNFALIPGLFAAAGIIAGYRGNRRLWGMMAAFIAASFFEMASPGKFFAHYYQFLLPPFAVGAGWAIVEFERNRAGRSLSWLPKAAGAAAVALILIHELPFHALAPDEWSRKKYGDIFVEEKRLGREIDKLLKPGETFFQWGDEPGLYFESRRRPPTGVTWVKVLLDGPLKEKLSSRTLTDLERARPELLIVAPQGMYRREGPVFDWLMNHYEPMPGGNKRGIFTLYVLRGGKLEARCKNAD